MKSKCIRSTAFSGRLIVVLLFCGVVPAARAFDPLSGDFTKEQPLDVRVVAYNHGQHFIEDPSRDAAFNRILTALNPDIICFEEFGSSVSQSDISNRLNSILPISGGSWQIHFGLLGGIRTVLASRYPLTMTRTDTIPASSTRGVTIALADLPDADYASDLYLLGVHLKCCGDPGGSEDASRQDSADAIANWLGDARGVSRPSGDNISLPPDTPMINLGDFNLVGGPQPENTLITGDIQDEVTYGPDVKGDWDVSDMTDLHPIDPFTGDDFTWQGSSTYPPSRLDRMFFTDSAVSVAHSFILNTDTMSPAALAAAGLQATDTLPDYASDHLPITADLRLVTVTQCTGDQDCDDGLFCNGAETCDANNTCQSGTDPCPQSLCRESDDTCVECLTAADCNDGVFCNGAEVCADGTCQAGGYPCPGQMCDEAGGRCVECLIDADCDDGNPCTGFETCADGACQAGSCDGLLDVVNENFDSGPGGFAYTDDTFGTSDPGNADGTYEAAGGYQSTGGLRVYLGPGRVSGDMSGGWTDGFSLAEAGTVTISLRFRLVLGAGYESSEYGEAILAVDGSRYGSDSNSSLVHVAGDGNGGADDDTGWLYDSFDIPLPAGAHTLIVGAYNNGATASDEWVECLFDDVQVTAVVAAECTCDDGLFCNGTEICVGSVCQSSGDPCVAQMCDEAADQCTPYGDGDFDGDGDVDLADFAGFQRCFATVGAQQCLPANMTGADGTINLADFESFATALTGP